MASRSNLAEHHFRAAHDKRPRSVDVHGERDLPAINQVDPRYRHYPRHSLNNHDDQEEYPAEYGRISRHRRRRHRRRTHSSSRSPSRSRRSPPRDSHISYSRRRHRHSSRHYGDKHEDSSIDSGTVATRERKRRRTQRSPENDDDASTASSFSSTSHRQQRRSSWGKRRRLPRRRRPRPRDHHKKERNESEHSDIASSSSTDSDTANRSRRSRQSQKSYTRNKRSSRRRDRNYHSQRRQRRSRHESRSDRENDDSERDSSSGRRYHRSHRQRRRRRHHHRHRRHDHRDHNSDSDSQPLRFPQLPQVEVPPRAGVVSEDDELAGQGPGSKRSTHHLHSQHQHQQQGETAPTKNSQSDPTLAVPKRRTSPSSSHDDTVGHYKGKEGDVIAERYRIKREVGVGTFGRVLECLDLKRRRRDSQQNYGHHRRRQERNSYADDTHNDAAVAIKVVRNVKRYYESALIEADILEDVNRRGGRGISHCAVMYDAFSFAGHYCMVFEKLGPSLYDFLKRQKYRPFPLICVRDFAKQMLEALEFLHSFRLVHTDLKPENILLLSGREVNCRGKIIPECTRIKIIDFGGATYDNEKKSSIVNTRQYRAPEVILGVGWSMPSDLWSAGCILAELYQGDLLFATHDNIEHLGLIEQIIGPFPRRMLRRAKNTQLVDEVFDSLGVHRMGRVLSPESLAYVKRVGALESTIFKEDKWFLRLLRRILVIDPEERATARDLLSFFG